MKKQTCEVGEGALPSRTSVGYSGEEIDIPPGFIGRLRRPSRFALLFRLPGSRRRGNRRDDVIVDRTDTARVHISLLPIMYCHHGYFTITRQDRIRLVSALSPGEAYLFPELLFASYVESSIMVALARSCTFLI